MASAQATHLESPRSARALYRKHGFAECGPFGSYRQDKNSTFMTALIR